METEMQTSTKFIAVLLIIVGVSSLVYTYSKCGNKTFFLGNGGVFAAASGMCDKGE
jgi:hypothetical protein